ncbi:MAG: hypothetical protein U1E73_05775 [Planctomycetota bacterium]
MKHASIGSLVTFAFLFAFAAACSASPAGRLAALRYDEVLGQDKMPAISYTLSGNADEPNLQRIVEIRTPDYLVELLRRAYAGARRMPKEGPDAHPDELHLDIYMRRAQRHIPITLTTGLLFLCTIGIAPAYCYEETYLDVRVVRSGELRKQYVYVDGVTTWYELFLLPWAFTSDPSDVTLKTMENMLLHFVTDMRRDMPEILR